VLALTGTASSTNSTRYVAQWSSEKNRTAIFVSQ